jgi:hypothetical protein
VRCFGLQCTFRDEQREIAVLDPKFFDILIERIFDRIPNRKRPRSCKLLVIAEKLVPQYVASRNVIIRDHLSLGDDLSIPFGKFLGFINSQTQSFGFVATKFE